MPQMPFAGRTLQRRIELLLHAFASVWERYTIRYVTSALFPILWQCAIIDLMWNYTADSVDTVDHLPAHLLCPCLLEIHVTRWSFRRFPILLHSFITRRHVIARSYRIKGISREMRAYVG